MSNTAGTIQSQRKLLEALFSGKHAESFDNRGLEIYRRNLTAAAQRSLSITFPTLSCLVGALAMGRLARDFLRSHRRDVFDWGQWGRDFPRWLEERRLTNQYPYLADCARLDWCVHCASRSSDPRWNYASFSALTGLDDFNFTLEFAPSTQVIRSAYPVVTIYRAHREDDTDPDLGEARTMLRNRQGQSALVWRQGLHTQVRELSAGELVWFRLLDDRTATVDDVLREADNNAMPFEHWLDQAIRERLVIGLRQSTIIN